MGSNVANDGSYSYMAPMAGPCRPAPPKAPIGGAGSGAASAGTHRPSGVHLPSPVTSGGPIDMGLIGLMAPGMAAEMATLPSTGGGIAARLSCLGTQGWAVGAEAPMPPPVISFHFAKAIAVGGIATVGGITQPAPEGCAEGAAVGAAGLALLGGGIGAGMGVSPGAPGGSTSVLARGMACFTST